MTASSLAPLPELDLSRVMPRVRKDNPDWNAARLEAARIEYLRFLQLCKSFPERKISAPPDIDEVWHAHMLDSVYYHRDCGHYFGYYLHHDPCLGEADISGAHETLATYQSAFGEAAPDVWRRLMTCANPGEGCGSIPAT